TTEHRLDHYGTMDVYASMKHRLFARQTSEDHAIANAEDARVLAGARASRARVWEFSSAREVEAGAFLGARRGEIILRLDGGVERYPTDELRIVGTHNLENAMAAFLAGRLAGVPAAAVRAAARAFRPLPPPLELLGDPHHIP